MQTNMNNLGNVNKQILIMQPSETLYEHKSGAIFQQTTRGPYKPIWLISNNLALLSNIFKLDATSNPQKPLVGISTLVWAESKPFTLDTRC